MISFDGSYPRLAESSHATRVVRAPRETSGGRLVVKGSSQPPLSHVVAMKWTPVSAGAVRMLRHCTHAGTAGGKVGASQRSRESWRRPPTDTSAGLAEGISPYCQAIGVALGTWSVNITYANMTAHIFSAQIQLLGPHDIV